MSKLNDYKEWLIKAERDWETAEILRNHNLQLSDIICFHLQQSSEKYLKALCIKNSLLFPKTHILSVLLEILRQKYLISDNLFIDAENLEDYAVDVRYPDDFNELTESEVIETIQRANNIKSFVMEKLNEK